MKRVLSLILAVAMMCTLFCSCGKSDEQALTPSNDNGSANATEVETTAKPAEILSDKNSKISIEGLLDAELLDTYITDEIEEEIGGITHGYPSQNGGMLVVLDFKLLNKSTKELKVYEVSTNEKLIYDGTYEYEGSATTFSDLTPLSEVHYYVIYEVPETVANGTGPLVAHFSIGENSYIVNVR